MSSKSNHLTTTALKKEHFSRENTILNNYDEDISHHSRHSKVKSKRTASDKKSTQSHHLEKEETLLEISPENTIFNGTSSQKLYIQACKMLRIPASDLMFESFNQSVFRLYHRYSNEEEIFAFAIGIAHSNSIIDVQFIDNRLSNTSLLHVFAAIWENENIVALEICENPLTEQAMKAINDLVKEQDQLRRLTLKGCNIVDSNGSLTPQLVNFLNCLNLSYNRLEDSTIQLIAHNLVKNEVLKELDLSWNCIRTKGAGFLCKALLANKTLTLLNLSMNGIESLGATYFAELLMMNKSLDNVDISSNRVFDTGLNSLVKVFSKSKTIKRFGFGNNPVSTKGVRILLESLESNRSSVLELLELHGIYIEKSTQDLIDRLKTKKPNLKIILKGVVSRGTEFVIKEFNGLMFPNPLEAIRFHIETTGSRLLDFFRFLDRRNTNRITRADFVNCLNELKYPYSESQIDDLMELLDPDNTGEVNFASLAAQDYQVKKLNRKRREKERQRLAKEVRHSPEPIKGDSESENSASDEEEEEEFDENDDEIDRYLKKMERNSEEIDFS